MTVVVIAKTIVIMMAIVPKQYNSNSDNGLTPITIWGGFSLN